MLGRLFRLVIVGAIASMVAAAVGAFSVKRRLTPTTMRSTRQVLVSRRRAASVGVMPWRATIVQTCRAYSENGRSRRICRVAWLRIEVPFFHPL